jgi:UDP-glucose 4-epimerase|tara:strand:- start:3511 stop:4509 length:999 start_codon:yes stop_codon:yes gene_type:complete
MFKNKILLITGGTGSFGNAVLNKFLDSDLSEIRIFSRDEKKQDDMRKLYKNNKIKFYLGDVRDPSSLEGVMRGVDYVFHAAALKQVPSCEFHPLEAVKTNVLGTSNVLEAAFKENVSNIICLSTDKAVYPINAMGTSKAMMEKVVLAKSRNSPDGCKICLTRYGNVMASRGSVIPLFDNQIKLNKPLTVTNSEMTRFMMTLEDAVNLVMHAFENGSNGDIYVQKSPAASIKTLIDAILLIRNKQDYPIQEIGVRHGEKQFEVLCSREEMLVAEDDNNYYRIPLDGRDLNYEKYFEKGSKKMLDVEEYNSDNTHRLGIEEMKELLMKLEMFNA